MELVISLVNTVLLIVVILLLPRKPASQAELDTVTAKLREANDALDQATRQQKQTKLKKEK